MIRAQLSMDGLYQVARDSFEYIQDQRRSTSITFSLADSLIAGLSVFTFKCESLLKFEDLGLDENLGRNLRALLKMTKIPSDTQLRDILDPVNPEELRPAFDGVLRAMQRGNELKEFMFRGYYPIGLDGTGYYSSSNIMCDCCLVKKSKSKEADDGEDSNELIYHHQMLGAAIVHPYLKQVIPLFPEPIKNEDGQKKNDCERNASKRWVEKFRSHHPKMPVIILEDSLASNVPHLEILKKFDCRYLTGVKEGDHRYLFEQFMINSKTSCTSQHMTAENKGEKVIKTITKEYEFINGLELNRANSEFKTNLIVFKEKILNKKTGSIEEKKFSWVTDLDITESNVADIVILARRRWGIENEVFKTLKDVTAYNIEHNYGHGSKNLAVNFALLAFLAFLIDQVLEATCSIVKEILSVVKKKSLWPLMKIGLEFVEVNSWNEFLELIHRRKVKKLNTG